MVVLLFVGAPLVGVVAAWWAHGEARATVGEQRADRRPVRAEVVGRASDALPVAQGGRHPSTKMTVRWTEPGEGPRTATTRVPAGTGTGDMVDVWLDSRGRAVAPPPDSTAVWQHTATLGVCAAGGAVAVILLGHTVVRRAAMRRRLEEWEQEWARTEPEWTGRRA